jgi:hypothetical protein
LSLLLSSCRRLQNNRKWNKWCPTQPKRKRRIQRRRKLNNKLQLWKWTRQNTKQRCARTGLKQEYAGIQINVNSLMADMSWLAKSPKMKGTSQRTVSNSSRRVSAPMVVGAYSSMKNVASLNSTRTSTSQRCSALNRGIPTMRIPRWVLFGI